MCLKRSGTHQGIFHSGRQIQRQMALATHLPVYLQ